MKRGGGGEMSECFTGHFRTRKGGVGGGGRSKRERREEPKKKCIFNNIFVAVVKL